MDFSTVELTEDQKKFRDEVRAFLDEHLTDAVQARRHAAQVNYDEEFYLAMGAKGWLEPRWSKEEGGAGFDDLQARILATELRRLRNARRIVRACGGKLAMFTDAFSRSRSPIRGSAGSLPSPATWRAGNT